MCIGVSYQTIIKCVSWWFCIFDLQKAVQLGTTIKNYISHFNSGPFFWSGNDSDISSMQLNSSVGPRAIFRVPVRKAYNAILLFSPVNICICPLWLPGSFQGTVMFLYQGNPHWTQCTSLAWVVVFFMPRPYFCPSGREVTISDVFAEHPKPQGYMPGFRCVLVTLKTPLGGNLWNSIFLLPNDNGRK